MERTVKLALKSFDKDELLFVFCDTGYEHPLTYSHVDWMEKEYGVQVVRLENKKSVYDLVIQTGCFPTDIMRFCTNELKIQRGKNFYARLAVMQECGFEVWYGMRLGESLARSKRYKDKKADGLYPPHEVLSNYPKYLSKLGIKFRLPILELEEEDVFEILGGEENPLYSKGFDRVGCFPCLASGDKPKEKAFNLDDVGKQRRIEVLQIAEVIGKNIFTSKGGLKRNPDSDVMGKLEIQDGALYTSEDVAPCHICNI